MGHSCPNHHCKHWELHKHIGGVWVWWECVYNGILFFTQQCNVHIASLQRGFVARTVLIWIIEDGGLFSLNYISSYLTWMQILVEKQGNLQSQLHLLQSILSDTFLSHNSNRWGWVTITIFSRALRSITCRHIPLIESTLPFIQRSLPLVQRLQPLQQRSLPLCELSGLPEL